MPSIDEMLTIAPPPLAFIRGCTDFIPRKQPTWLTLMTVM
jgi:hypothetical protein